MLEKTLKPKSLVRTPFVMASLVSRWDMVGLRGFAGLGGLSWRKALGFRVWIYLITVFFIVGLNG